LHLSRELLGLSSWSSWGVISVKAAPRGRMARLITDTTSTVLRIEEMTVLKEVAM
jgi:serine/threonine protein kinase HipA of HipAB toxin-antitoxin module